MSELAETLKAQLASLPRDERVELLEFLELSLVNGTSEDLESAWDAELNRRWQQIESGEVVGIPVEQMAERLRKKYR